MSKVLLSVDDALLRRIDEKARRERISRSAYIARLAARDLGEELGPGAHPEVMAAIKELRAAFAHLKSDEDSTDAIRRMRDEA